MTATMGASARRNNPRPAFSIQANSGRGRMKWFRPAPSPQMSRPLSIQALNPNATRHSTSATALLEVKNQTETPPLQARVPGPNAAQFPSAAKPRNMTTPVANAMRRCSGESPNNTAAPNSQKRAPARPTAHAGPSPSPRRIGPMSSAARIGITPAAKQHRAMAQRDAGESCVGSLSRSPFRGRSRTPRRFCFAGMRYALRSWRRRFAFLWQPY